MTRWIALAVLPAVMLACAPAPGAGAAGPEALHYESAVVVDNGAPVPVVIKYYRLGGGPFVLDVVNSGQSRTLVLPSADIGHVFAETEDGRRFSSRQGTVQIRRVSPPRS